MTGAGANGVSNTNSTRNGASGGKRAAVNGTSAPTGDKAVPGTAQASTGGETSALASLEADKPTPNYPLVYLNAYRFAHRLPIPAPYTNPLHRALLTNPGGIGRRSPTAVARARRAALTAQKAARSMASAGAASAAETRSSRAGAGGVGHGGGGNNGNGETELELIAAVRRHFNAMAAEEVGVIAGFLYATKNQHKAFRIRQWPRDGLGSSSASSTAATAATATISTGAVGNATAGTTAGNGAGPAT